MNQFMNRRLFLKQSLKYAGFLAVTGIALMTPLRLARALSDMPVDPRAEDEPNQQTGTPPAANPADGGKVTIEKTDAEWKRILTPEQYWVLRLRGTEKPYSSPLEKEHRNGIFACAGCALPLFSSDTKFESGTGWPSFYQPLPDAVATVSDHELLESRTEVHCRRCGGHLGHVFDDGPRPTGLRYCMNGVAMNFTPEVAAVPSP